jgi:D-sedoheptulose 7-phosphate isomerase
MRGEDYVGDFRKKLDDALSGMEVTGRNGALVGEGYVERALSGQRAFFIGNGGSAAIASHMATDFSNKGNVPSLALNDLSALTCISNDYKYENVFVKQLRWHAHAHDWLFAISSSGKSKNILWGADFALEWGMEVVTLTGFSPRNKLREMGMVNFYVPSSDYGIVETAHLGILHALLERVAKK